MIYLVVGVDRRSLAPWHKNVAAGDIAAAVRTACARARRRGVDPVVAAVIGPGSAVLAAPGPRIVAPPVTAPGAPSRSRAA
jgi:hypothetical protein